MEKTTNEYNAYAKVEMDDDRLYALACYGLIQSYGDDDVPEQLKKKYIEYRIKGGIKDSLIRFLYERMKLEDENKEMVERVREKTKEIKLNLIEAHTVKIYTSRGLNTIDYGQQFDEAYSKRRKAFCMYYHQYGKQVQLADPEFYRQLIDEFKSFINKYKTVVSSIDVERKGKKLYAICFGKEGESQCHFSMACFSLMINGLAYYFFTKENRDKVLTYITK